MSSKYSFKFTPLTDPKKTVFMANVTFEPKCRNNRHIHHATAGGGQILLCVDGRGWYQEENKPAVELHPRRRDYHSRKRKALAWSGKEQLVFAYCRGVPRRKHENRMV